LNALNSGSHIPFWTSWYDFPIHCPYANDCLSASIHTHLPASLDATSTNDPRQSQFYGRGGLTCAAHDFDALANVLSGVRSLNVVFADILLDDVQYQLIN
jgi:hypothetical protein